jgi:hypothetical protein
MILTAVLGALCGAAERYEIFRQGIWGIGRFVIDCVLVAPGTVMAALLALAISLLFHRHIRLCLQIFIFVASAWATFFWLRL